MKRIISGAILVILISLLFVFSGYPLVVNFFVVLLSFLSLLEFFKSSGYIENRLLFFLSSLFSVTIPFLHLLPRFGYSLIVFAVFVFVVIITVALIVFYDKESLEKICIAFSVSAIIPLFFSTMIYARLLKNGLFYLIMIFIVSWATDTGGFVFGKMFGRHKMCPKISPNKTIEGAIGGFLFSIGGFLIFSFIVDTFTDNISVNYFMVVLFAFIGSFFAILGDLFASILKRNYNVKDFGYLIPGHGGILDRFDSVLFAAPALFLLFEQYPLFKII